MNHAQNTAQKVKATIAQIRRYLNAAEDTPPVKFRPFKKSPSSSDWPRFPGKKPAPGRPSVTEIPTSHSEALDEAIRLLMEAHAKAEAISEQIAAAKRKIAEEFGAADQEAKKSVSDLATRTWQILEKNRGVIEESDEIFMRIRNYIVGARGARHVVTPPTPLPPDPRVDAAIRFIAEKVPALVAEFTALLSEIEKQHLLAQPEEDRTQVLPPELGVYDLEAKASVRIGHRRVAGVLDKIYRWLQHVYSRFVSFLGKLRRFEAELDELMVY